MSSNLAVEEPMAADPAKNPGGDELREESSAAKSTEEVEIRGSSETVIEERTTVVVTETKVELVGSVSGSEDKSTGGVQGGDLVEEVSVKKDTSHVESTVVGGGEEGNDPTEISLHDLTGGLDIDGQPTGEEVEEVVVEAAVENEADLGPSLTEVAGESKDGLIDSHSDEQIQVADSTPTGASPEQPELKGSIVKELGEELDKERSIDGDKTMDNLEARIESKEIKDLITGEKVIEACDAVQMMEEGAEDLSTKATIACESAQVDLKYKDTANRPDVDKGPTVEENEGVVKKVTSDSCIEPMDGSPRVESLVAEHVQSVGVENVSADISEQVTEAEQPDDLVLDTHEPMDTDGTAISEEKSGQRSEDIEEKPASSLDVNSIAHDVTHVDGKEAVVYHRREKHHTTKNATVSPEPQTKNAIVSPEPQKEETIFGEMHIIYNIPSVVKDGFAISDLVWGKVKSHPWWPGVIINPSDGSNLALKYQKKDAFLVAYFGDKTFAWCDESQLKPFFPNFSHFEKQASTDAFSNAVRSVLVEVSRRFEVGTICSCLDQRLFAKEVHPKLENAGVRQGFDNCAVDRYELVKYFNPKGLVDFIKDLSLQPTKIIPDKLEHVMVTSQVKAFYRLKGYSVPPNYQTFGPLEDYIEPVIVLHESEKLPENSVMLVQTPPAVTPPAVNPSVNAPLGLAIIEKPKKKRGRPPKKKNEELDVEVQKPLSELVHKRVHSKLANGSQSTPKTEKATTDEEDSASPLPWKKMKEVVGVDLVEQENQAQTPRSTGFGISFKIGECISRAASRLTGSGSSPLISTPKFDSADFDVSSDEETPMPTTNEEKPVRRRRLKKYHYSDPKDVLSQLCLSAISPRKEYSFQGTVINYFTDFRSFMVDPPPSAEMVHLPEKVKLRKGRKRKVDLPSTPSDEVVTPSDHMQDSYWSDMILCGQNDETSSMRKQRKRRVSIETKHLKLTPGGPDAKRALAVAEAALKRPIIRVEERRLDECNPTALLLSFGTRYGTVPSEMDIVRIFSRYGPLKEWEMGEVEGSTNRVWILFKRRADAEMSFSSLRKENVFGPSLVSYRLVYEMPKKSEQEKKAEVPNGGEHKSFQLLEREETVDVSSIPQGDDATVVVSRNIKGLDADEMLVDPLSNVEASDVAKGDNVGQLAVDPVSNFRIVDAEVLSVNTLSNVEIVDVSQGDGMDKVPVDPSGNVEEGDVDAMLIDPSSTAQVETIATVPLSSTAELSVHSSSNMEIDTSPKILIDHFNTVGNEDANENLADPSSTTMAEVVSEAAAEPPVSVHVEAFEEVTTSSTILDEGAVQLCLNTPSTAHDAAINEPETVQDCEVVVLGSNTMSSQNCSQTDPSGILHSEIVSDISIVPASAGEEQVVVEAPVELTSTEKREEVGVTSVESTNTEQGEVLGEMQIELVSIEESEVAQEIHPSTTNSEQGEVVSEMPTEVVSIEECEVAGEKQPASSEQGKVDEALVELTSTEKQEEVGVTSVETTNTERGEVLGEMQIELVSIEEGEVAREIHPATANSEQGEVVSEIPTKAVSIEECEVAGEIQPASSEQGEVDEAPVELTSTEKQEEVGVTSVETTNTERGEGLSEMQIELVSIEEGEVAREIHPATANSEQGEVVSEIPTEAVSIEECEVAGEIQPASSEQGKVDEAPVELTSTEKQDEVGVASVETTNTEQGEVLGEMQIELVSIEEGEVAREIHPATANSQQGELVSEIPTEAVSIEECEVAGEIQPASSEQGKVDGEVPVEPARSEPGIEDCEIAEPSSIGEDKAVGEMSVEPASTDQGEVVGEVPVDASSIEQGEVTVELPVDPASSVHGKVVGEVPVELSSMEQGETTVEMPVDPSSTADGVVAGIPVKPSSTEQIKDDEVQVEPASTKQDSDSTEQIKDDEVQVEPASTKQDSERSVELLKTEEGEVVG